MATDQKILSKVVLKNVPDESVNYALTAIHRHLDYYRERKEKYSALVNFGRLEAGVSMTAEESLEFWSERLASLETFYDALMEAWSVAK